MRTGLQIISHCWKNRDSSSSRDAWFVGAYPALLSGFWIGHDENLPMPDEQGGGRRHVCGVVSVKKPFLYYHTVKCFRFQNRSGFQHVRSRVCWQQKIAQMLVIIPTLTMKCRSIFVISIQEKF